MYCQNCGKQINNGSKFCPDCGAQVSAPPAARSSASVNITFDHEAVIKVLNVLLICLLLSTLFAALFLPISQIRTVWTDKYYDVGMFIKGDEDLLAEFGNVGGKYFILASVFCFLITGLFAAKPNISSKVVTIVLSIASVLLMNRATASLNDIEGADLIVTKHGSGYIVFMISIVAYNIIAVILSYLKYSSPQSDQNLAKNMVRHGLHQLSMGSGADDLYWVCSCGADNPSAVKYCKVCGKAKNSKKSGEQWECSCGCMNTSESSHCKKCGRSKPML